MHQGPSEACGAQILGYGACHSVDKSHPQPKASITLNILYSKDGTLGKTSVPRYLWMSRVTGLWGPLGALLSGAPCRINLISDPRTARTKLDTDS